MCGVSATSSVAADSKKSVAYDQNLMTEWHARYGGRGVMIYWCMSRSKSVCIYSQLKRCSSSEVASMIEGVLHHGTEMEVERQYVDSHGQSEVAFAFCRLLNFSLLPRLKAISSQRLYLPAAGTAGQYPNLSLCLTRPIDWELIRTQYDETVRYATALLERTADAESILRRFTRSNRQHPTYRALAELGKAVKTIFLCDYLGSDGAAPGDPRGPQRGGELERGKRLHPLSARVARSRRTGSMNKRSRHSRCTCSSHAWYTSTR